jgi:branched-chain amino acid transport system ATP-binding protein
VLQRLDIEPLAGRLPAELSHGHRNLVSVARALAAGPRAVLLDEPAAGLDQDESRALGRRLRQVVDEGVTVLLVDHDMSLVLSVCDRIHVLDFGRTITEGTPAEIRSSTAVIDAYLGVPDIEKEARP